ncbi:MAG: hypothetical protein IIU88_00750 [Clostridia bacterium]|nr:hypothetical protein [Clostridia bacterium]
MKPTKTDRFVCTEVSGGAFDACQCRVLVDRQTGVNYLWTTGGYSGGLTVMVDADGRPIVTSVPREEK